MDNEPVIILAGNPNVGKSTVFNALTGMDQHTGNWSGKTVDTAAGFFKGKNGRIKLIDIPGTYSLNVRSRDEAVARDALCFEPHDAVAAVCDASCLERNLVLVLQIAEFTQRLIVCVNMMDEAKKKNISLDLEKLSELTGITFIGISARHRKTLAPLTDVLDCFENLPSSPLRIAYPEAVEQAASEVEKALAASGCGFRDLRWAALRLLDPDTSADSGFISRLGADLTSPELRLALSRAKSILISGGIEPEKLGDIIAGAAVKTARELCAAAVRRNGERSGAQAAADRTLTGKYTAYPVLLLLLLFIFFLTFKGANYPSELLFGLFSRLGNALESALSRSPLPPRLQSCITEGIFGVTARVISVMLPPMAVFFPLFTVFEDLGLLPRAAYVLDKPFQKRGACGKQALTMCMGFGCSAVGVSGARIINSPRERLLAVLTNCFVPCNGKFPALVALISMFFVTFAPAAARSAVSALLLLAMICGGIFLTFLSTRLLSLTLLKGAPSSYFLELPPFRMPKFGSIILRSLIDRTVFVLGRAAAAAVPAGIVIWCAADIFIGDRSLLAVCADALDPFARLMGLDGVILISFILGLPANEIVLPVMVMAYSSLGAPPELNDLPAIKELLVSNGWTAVTAVCAAVFFISHFPCSTTMMTIKKETGSLKWTLVSAALPTGIGIILCMMISAVSKLFAVL